MKCDCENMGYPCEGEVKMRHSMTAYHWDKESGKPDPNANFPACESHYLDYYTHYKEMWDEYYAGIL